MCSVCITCDQTGVEQEGNAGEIIMTILFDYVICCYIILLLSSLKLINTIAA